jgi:hypothetical protein
MNALVRTAPARALYFSVMALVIFVVRPLAALTTPTDIFPAMRTPVIAVI